MAFSGNLAIWALGVVEDGDNLAVLVNYVCCMHVPTVVCISPTTPCAHFEHLLHTCRELLASLIYPIPIGISVVTSEPI